MLFAFSRDNGVLIALISLKSLESLVLKTRSVFVRHKNTRSFLSAERNQWRLWMKEERLEARLGPLCPCTHLFTDWLLSLNLANALVKQSAETIHHCIWQKQGVYGGGGVLVGGGSKCVHAWVQEGGSKREGKRIREKEGWGERDRQEKEESEVVWGGGGCWSVEMSLAH